MNKRVLSRGAVIVLGFAASAGAAGAQELPTLFAPPWATLGVAPPAQAAAPPAAAPVATAPVVHRTGVASTSHPAAAHRKHRRLAAEAKTKRLADARPRVAPHHGASTHPEPAFAAGMIVPPPGMTGPPPDDYRPYPYRRFVYGGPPPGPYRGWGGYGGYYR